MPTRPETTVESYAVHPLGQIGFGDATAQHPLEVHDEIECDLVHIVRIDEHHIFTPFRLLLVVVHI